MQQFEKSQQARNDLERYAYSDVFTKIFLSVETRRHLKQQDSKVFYVYVFQIHLVDFPSFFT